MQRNVSTGLSTVKELTLLPTTVSIHEQVGVNSIDQFA